MRNILITILIAFTINTSAVAQEIDTVSRELIIELGADSLYNEQLQLKSNQGILSDCEFAIQNANKDFNEQNYTLHSGPFSGDCSYCAVLRQDYNVKWEFTGDLFSNQYYKCYDSIMSRRLIEMYNYDIFKRAKEKGDSLTKTDKWIRNAEYVGGRQELMKFFMARLTIDSADMGEIKTKLYIELEIDSTGKAINPIIRKGIGEKTDKKVIEIIKEMPDWKPAYLYGKPIRQKYYIPINIDYQ